MNIFSLICFLFLLFSHLPVPAFSYMFNGFEVLDLQYDYPAFTYEALVWKDSQASSGSSITLACSSGTKYIIGGPAKSTSGSDNYFSRVYTGLQYHTMIYYSFDLWIIDTWASGSISIGFDSHVQTSGWTFISTNFPAITSVCGGSGPDLSSFRVFGKALHSGSTLTFKLMGVPSSSSTTGSLGLRNLNLLFVAKPSSKTEDICGIATAFLNANTCPWTEGSYLPNSMSPMLPCDSNCESCFGGTAKDCYKCAATSRYNGTQCVSCSQTDKNILDADGVCKNCQGFEVVYDKRTDTGHYFQMYLVPEPCDLNVHEVRNNLAFQAQDNDDFPDFDFLVAKLGDNLYQIELIMKGDSVKETTVTVTLYYMTGTMMVPRTFLVTSLVESLNKATLPMQIVLAIILAISFFGAVALKNTEILWHIVGFMQFVEYLQYINIICPPQVYSFISYFGFSLWDFLPGIGNSAQDGVALSSLDYAPKSMKAKWDAPQQFRTHDIDSFFLANGGFLNFLISVLMLLTLAMIILLRNSPSFSRSNTVKFLKIKLRWRAIIRFFLYSCAPLSMSIFLQLRAITFSNGYIAFSAVLTIFSLIYLLAMIVFLVKILYKRPASLLSMQLITNIYGTLYEGIKFNDKGTGKYYYLVVMLREILLTILVALAESIPLVQIVGVLYLSIGVVVYLLKKTTFTNRGSNWVIRINEFVMMIIQLCMLCLHFEVNSKVFYQVFGWMMAILVTIGFSGPFVYYMGIQIFYIDKIMKTISSWNKPRRTAQGFANTNEVIKLKPQDRSQIFTASETSVSYNLNDSSILRPSNTNDISIIRSPNINDSSLLKPPPPHMNDNSKLRPPSINDSPMLRPNNMNDSSMLKPNNMNDNSMRRTNYQ